MSRERSWPGTVVQAALAACGFAFVLICLLISTLGCSPEQYRDAGVEAWCEGDRWPDQDLTLLIASATSFLTGTAWNFAMRVRTFWMGLVLGTAAAITELAAAALAYTACRLVGGGF